MSSQTPIRPATVTVGKGQEGFPINRRLFGSFVEHAGRAVYGGIYEPGHPTADADGFRHDVIELVKELGVTTVRYPGGNFVSGYQWEDGIGPKESRPRRLDLAWHSLETNDVGVDEFARWCETAGLEPMMAVNLGTRGIAEALALLEYCNHPGGTEWSDRRIANGTVRPHDMRMWCLGNEMDGPWQIGHLDADAYGALAARTAAAMKLYDPTLQLIACGSSGSYMPTFGEWERTVLGHTYEHVDYISCHAYYAEREGDLDSFLASAVDLQRFVDTVVDAADDARRIRGGTKDVALSFDEWNVWYSDFEADAVVTKDWPAAPPILENSYSVADAVVVGSLLIALLKNADRVAAASLAQLVNAIAPIMTVTGGPSWRQTTFFPFAITSRLARGVALVPSIESDDYDTQKYGRVPEVDAVVTDDETTGKGAAFLVNRSRAAVSVTIRLERSVVAIDEAVTLSDDDVTARNTAEAPDRVGPLTNPTARWIDGALRIDLPPVSWSAIAFH